MGVAGCSSIDIISILNKQKVVGSQITQGIYDGYANIGETKEALEEKGLSGLTIPVAIHSSSCSFLDDLGYHDLVYFFN